MSVIYILLSLGSMSHVHSKKCLSNSTFNGHTLVADGEGCVQSPSTLFSIFFCKTTQPGNIKVAARPTRAGGKLVYKIPSKCTTVLYWYTIMEHVGR